MCPKQTLKKSKITDSTTSDTIDTKHHNSTKSSCKKTNVRTIIKEELEFISNIFNILEVSTLVHGKRNLIEEEEDDLPEPLDVPEEKIFQKHKKNSGQPSSKVKPFPKKIDGLQKELDELKGLASMTYQQKLRKKGLQSRLVKKKRKELKISSGKKRSITVNGQIKFIKPVLNSDGNVVNNKFDFAESEVKNEKRERNDKSSHTKKKTFNSTNADESGNMEVQSVGVKKESSSIEANLQTNKLVFNKDNKMVFSKVFIPENIKKIKGTKDPKKMLDKIKENSKKISELEKEDKEKATALKDKQTWAAALKRASGETVRDDPELLRKSIAREKNQKMRSQKKWNARLDQVQKEKDERQKKRTANIQARKTEKKKNKTKKAVKKGRIVQV